jgi:hypothetical protein
MVGRVNLFGLLHKGVEVYDAVSRDDYAVVV